MPFAYDISSSPLQQTRTLWMGDIAPYMDEAFIRQVWLIFGEHVNVKLIKEKNTGRHAGYCFVEFSSNAAALKALSLQGEPVPGTDRVLKLNWASGGMGEAGRDKSKETPQEYSIFVGDVAPEVTDLMLLSFFQSRYGSCKSAKIMTDPVTGFSRGYGFVRFTTQEERNRALVETHGVYCGSRPLRVSMALPKSKTSGSVSRSPVASLTPTNSVGNSSAPGALDHFSDPTNTTVFVGGLSAQAREDELRAAFAPFGEITHVKIPPGKGCGFVQYAHRQAAELAIAKMNGVLVGTSRVRLAWGRPHSWRTASSGSSSSGNSLGSLGNGGPNAGVGGPLFSGIMNGTGMGPTNGNIGRLGSVGLGMAGLNGVPGMGIGFHTMAGAEAFSSHAFQPAPVPSLQSTPPSSLQSNSISSLQSVANPSYSSNVGVTTPSSSGTYSPGLNPMAYLPPSLLEDSGMKVGQNLVSGGQSSQNGWGIYGN
ncbi:uncharacterized protein VTP21DRAFT_11417 [Calcarisporiella thermophila]|uniref:uncharacterized protein n=1 Tax=Calcarisporiella thermophila TaxID=911321 RepID=UPI0037429972